MATTNVVIIGSGVIGLTIAHVLSQDPSYRITIVARDFPDDMDSQAWASPWAGANWSPMPDANTERITKWEMYTFNKLWDMIPTGLAMELPSRIYFADYGPEAVAQVSWRNLVRNFRVLAREDVPSQYKSGVTFSTVSVHPQFYIPWLKSELDKRGVEFVRKHIASLEQAAALAGARSMIGVEDLEVYPIKGQGVIVESPRLKEFFAVIDEKIPDGHVVYIIPRPGDDTVILGGTYLEDVWDTSIDYSISRDIFARCSELTPLLTAPETRILSHRAGLRPARRGGPRVEAEWVELPLKGQLVPTRSSVERKLLCVHAYGLGAAGYQRSWGVAEEVKNILMKVAPQFAPSKM